MKNTGEVKYTLVCGELESFNPKQFEIIGTNMSSKEIYEKAMEIIKKNNLSDKDIKRCLITKSTKTGFAIISLRSLLDF